MLTEMNKYHKKLTNMTLLCSVTKFSNNLKLNFLTNGITYAEKSIKMSIFYC